jgi:hypothetical protein
MLVSVSTDVHRWRIPTPASTPVLHLATELQEPRCRRRRPIVYLIDILAAAADKTCWLARWGG